MNHKLKVMSVFGTRPEAIKMSVVVQRTASDPDIDSVVCITGQHRGMLDQVLEQFHIHPDYDLNIMKAKQTLYDITVAILQNMDSVLEQEKPDVVLVHGDTTTAITAALAAFYHQIPVGHVEAGLRTYDKYSPFPEEMNRQLISRIATYHFAPTVSNRQNLLREGITNNVYVTGNTVIDVVYSVVSSSYRFQSSSLREIDFRDGHRYIAVTAHRRENIGQPIQNICLAVQKIAEEFPDVRFIWPVHLNPAVHDMVCSMLGGMKSVFLVEPLNVFDMHNLISRCCMVMTDSGGLQEEAPSLGKPVLVLRQETERPEAIAAGTVKLVGTEKDDIFREAALLLRDRERYLRMANAVNPYGDGHASERIVSILKSIYFGEDYHENSDTWNANRLVNYG
jgi:UDP-N-acetylglucosamine 2-epimerase (non-hydrolysing)